MHPKAREATDAVLDISAPMDAEEAKRFLADVIDVLKANMEDLEANEED